MAGGSPSGRALRTVEQTGEQGGDEPGGVSVDPRRVIGLVAGEEAGLGGIGEGQARA
jgi:hypothetical protein